MLGANFSASWPLSMSSVLFISRKAAKCFPDFPFSFFAANCAAIRWYDEDSLPSKWWPENMHFRIFFLLGYLWYEWIYLAHRGLEESHYVQTRSLKINHRISHLDEYIQSIASHHRSQECALRKGKCCVGRSLPKPTKLDFNISDYNPKGENPMILF